MTTLDDHPRIDAALTSNPIAHTVTLPIEQACPLPATDGARVVFAGCIRNHDDGKAVDHLIYEAHPDAEGFLRRACEHAVAGYGVTDVYVRHRVGRLDIGDVALVVVVSSAHRAPAFAACAAIVDAIKNEVPIWKDQYFSDGTHAWSRCP